MDDLHKTLIEISWLQNLWTSALNIKRGAEAVLKQTPGDIQAESQKDKATEAMSEIAPILDVLEQHVVKHYQQEYNIKLRLFIKSEVLNVEG